MKINKVLTYKYYYYEFRKQNLRQPIGCDVEVRP